MIARRAVFLAAMVVITGAVTARAAEMRYAVYFEQSKVQITDAAREVIKFVAQDVAAKGARRVILVGHADTADMAPQVLSRYRAEGVAAELRRAGVPATVAIDVSGVGSQQPAVVTGVDVREPLNRRVTIAY